MTPERYQQIKSAYGEACVLEAAERRVYLDRLGATDAELRSEVESLLAHDQQTLPIRRPVEAAEALRAFAPGAAKDEPSSGLDPWPEADEEMPAQIGRYRVISRIGAGGMGVVYEAEQDIPRRTVALKIIRPGLASRDVMRRFQFEAHVLGQLQDPGIAQIYEAGTATVTRAGGVTVEQPFLAMELVRGEALGRYVERAGISLRRRLELLARICDAVHAAHQKGVIHRDLKPGNIRITESGQPKILDFGVARMTDADVSVTTMHTDLGQLIGTLPYMSPEQVEGDSSQLDTRSDVYALGVVAYQALTGQLPYEVRGKNVPEAVRVIREETAARLSTANRSLRGDLETIVATALEKDRGRRYQSAAEMAADIRRFLNDEPIAARPASALYQMRKFARRHRTLVGAMLVVVLALVAGTVISTVQWLRATRAEALASTRLDDALAAQADAEAAAAKAETISAFLMDMLRHVNPQEALGRDVSLLREILDDAAERIDTELAGFPTIQAEIHNTIGMVYCNISDYPDAERHLETARDLRLAHLGPDHPDTWASLGCLAELRWQQGRLEVAETLYRYLIARYAAELGENHADTLDLRFQLAGVLREQGRIDEAEVELSDVLTVMRAAFGDDANATLEATNGLAVLLRERGRLEEAEELLRGIEQLWAERHGEDSPQRLVALQNLASVVGDRGRLEEAGALKREVLRLARELYGEDHRSTVQAKLNLIGHLTESGALEEAESLSREVAAQAPEILGARHPDTLKSLLNLGIALRLRGKLEEAEGYLADAVALARQIHGENHPVTIDCLNGYAGVLHGQGKLAETEEIMRQVVKACHEAYGPTGIRTLMFTNNLGLLLVAMGEFEEAEALLADLVEKVDATAPPGHWFRLTARMSLGRCYRGQQRYEEAEEIFLECYEGFLNAAGPGNMRTVDAVEALVDLYDMWGQPDAAAEWRGKLPAEE